jgi:hypothetical protein
MSAIIVELKITNPKDWAIIQPLLKRLKISFTQKETPSVNGQKGARDEVLETLLHLAEQIDVSSYGDPVEYQREVRKDRPQPFRDND